MKPWICKETSQRPGVVLKFEMKYTGRRIERFMFSETYKNWLFQIWELADYSRKGSLDKTGAFVAFKLVAACQQGQPISWQSLSLKLEPPSFASRSATPSIPNFGTSSTNLIDNWAIDPADQSKYESIFDGLNPVDGKVSGDKVMLKLLTWFSFLKQRPCWCIS